jgi:SAM-dependent methyltransferase
MAESVAFDRAAEYYDRTRTTDPEAIRATIEVLESHLGNDRRVLEIGVGTGALALPLHERGVPLVGLDLSVPMMRKLVEKAGGVLPFPLVRGDATRLPFADDALGGAYARWVLHLISNWRDAVAELCRVVRPGGSVLIEPGGYGGKWRDLWLLFVDELGEAAVPVGLDARDGHADLDDAFDAGGAVRRELPTISSPVSGSIGRFLDETGARLYSWTWRIPEADLERAVATVRERAAERYGDLDRPFDPEVPMGWRAYEVAGATGR